MTGLAFTEHACRHCLGVVLRDAGGFICSICRRRTGGRVDDLCGCGTSILSAAGKGSVNIPFDGDRDPTAVSRDDGLDKNGAMAALKLTLDTNSVVNALDATSPTATSVDDLTALIRYGLSGKVEIAITTRVEDDLLRDKIPYASRPCFHCCRSCP